MINPEVYNDAALMSDWYNYRTRNLVSHELYQTMVDFDRNMIGIEDGVKEMVRTNWFNIMDENLRVAIAKERGRVAGEKVSNALINGTRILIKWVKRALVTGALVMVGVVVFNHGGDWYKELKDSRPVYQLEDEVDNRIDLVERLDKSDEYVIVEVPVPGHKPNR